MVEQPPPEARRAARAWSAARRRPRGATACSTSEFGRVEQGVERAAAAGADQIVGVLAGGQGDEAERAAGPDTRAAPAARRGSPLSARPRRRRSTARARARAARAGRAGLRSARCRAARPPRAIPAWSSAITSIWPSTTMTRLASRLAGAALSRLNRVRPLSNNGRVGRVQIFGLAGAEDAPGKGDAAPARIADREHQPAAEAVIGLLARFLRRDQQAGFDQFVIAELLERRLELAARNRGRGRSRICASVASLMPRSLR